MAVGVIAVLFTALAHAKLPMTQGRVPALCHASMTQPTCCASGLANHVLNSCWLRKRCGMRKCMRLQSSSSEFCSGVPVSSRRRRELKASKVCQRCDW